MKRIKLFEQFKNGNLSNDQVIELYQNFMRILKIHEEHFYHKTLISNDSNFKSELNKIFGKIKNCITEDLYNLVTKFEKELYNNNLMQSNYGNSLYDICDVIIEDPDTLNINRYIQDFSDSDVYAGSQDDMDKSIDEIDNVLQNLKNKLEQDDESWDDEEY